MTEDDHLKYRLIYRRFLLIFFSFLAVYSFLHWLLVLRLHLVDISEGQAIWASAFLPVIPLWIWLGKRMRLLQLLEDGKDQFPGILLMGHLAIAATTVSFQYYMIRATGELRALKTPEEITRYEPVKYYTIGSFYVDKRHAKFKRFQHISGKNNNTLNYELVIAVPLYTKAKEGALATVAATGDSTGAAEGYTNTVDPPIWVCLHYEKRLSNKITDAKKQQAWVAFEERSYQGFKNANINNVTYFERPGKGDYRDQLVETATNPESSNSALPNVLEPRYDPFHERTYEQIGWTLLIFILGAGMWWSTIYFKSFDTAALDKFKDQQNL